MPSEHSETDFSPKSVIEIARQNEVQTKEKRHSIKEKAAHFLHQSYEKFISRRLAMATREEMAGYKTVGEAIHQATPELNIDDPEYHLQRRLVANKEFALWYLIASKRYLKPAKEMAGPKASPDQVIDAETELAEAFLETQTTKNQESDHFRSPYLPSAGIEVEYLLSNLPVNRLDDLRKKHGFTHEDKPDAMGLDYQHDPTWDKVREILGSWQRTFTPFQYMREMGGFNNTISEVSFNPSASMKTQLRELLYLNKLNLVEPSYGVHININRLGISISHPEPMIITSLLTGCYYDKPNPSKKDRLLKMLRQPFHRDSQASPDSYLDSPSIIEDFPKPSADDQHFTLHRTRPPKDRYQNESDETVNGISTEFRGVTSFDNFSGLVRVVESTYWLSVAAIAKQDLDEKPEKKDDPTTLALAEVWDKLQSDWKDLLNQKRIDMQIERSIIQGTNINQKNRRDYLSKQQTIFTPYNQALGQILHLSEDDPKFQTQTRLLVIRARAQIKALVKAEAATIKPPLAKATLDDL